jgi:hypothetical protein
MESISLLWPRRTCKSVSRWVVRRSGSIFWNLCPRDICEKLFLIGLNVKKSLLPGESLASADPSTRPLARLARVLFGAHGRVGLRGSKAKCQSNELSKEEQNEVIFWIKCVLRTPNVNNVKLLYESRLFYYVKLVFCLYYHVVRLRKHEHLRIWDEQYPNFQMPRSLVDRVPPVRAPLLYVS